jgi:hypothetical protein
LAALLDRIVRNIPSLKLSRTEATYINNNAANIVLGITLSETIKGQVNFNVHILQLVINDCIASIPAIIGIINNCKSLVAKTHTEAAWCAINSGTFVNAWRVTLTRIRNCCNG